MFFWYGCHPKPTPRIHRTQTQTWLWVTTRRPTLVGPSGPVQLAANAGLLDESGLQLLYLSILVRPGRFTSEENCHAKARLHVGLCPFFEVRGTKATVHTRLTYESRIIKDVGQVGTVDDEHHIPQSETVLCTCTTSNDPPLKQHDTAVSSGGVLFNKVNFCSVLHPKEEVEKWIRRRHCKRRPIINTVETLLLYRVSCF